MHADEVKALPASSRRQQGKIELNKRKAIKCDIHELSNYLVSL